MIRGAVLGRVDRAHVDARLHAGADLELADPLLDHRPQAIPGVANGQDEGLGHATLAGRAVARGDGRVRGQLHVGVRQDDHRVLGSSVGADTLAVAGAGLEHVPPDGGGADELDGIDAGVLQDGIDSLASAVNDVEHAVRQPGLLPQLGLELRGAGRVTGGLPDEGVAGHEGDRVDPHRDHRREVEGRDAGGHAQGFPQGVGIDPRRDVRSVQAGQVDRQPAGEFDSLQAAHDLGQGVGEGLAVIARDQGRQLLTVAVDQGAVGEEDLAASDERRVAPARECPPGGGDGRVDLGRSPARNPGDHGTGRRIVDGPGVLGKDLDRTAVYPMAQDGWICAADRVGYLRGHDGCLRECCCGGLRGSARRGSEERCRGSRPARRGRP